ncbi:MAG: hypothetical protein E6K54_06220 [Gammaproteobacteria bacterium]|nr:MAG: hypothetical protein E6K54_06220 [Gammaproteobacteria bacterium]
MIPPKKNPILFPEDSLKVLNNFSDFVNKMPISVSESAQFKKDAIKVIESLKFIKINLEFIGYAVENKTDRSLYTYTTDRAKGLIRDFNGTGLHLNAYHNKKDVQIAFETLIRQFENAILAMQAVNKLEMFARQLQYDRNTGCIEARVSKALLFAATSLSSPAHPLDQLMAQCQFMPNDDTMTLLNKTKVFFKPYIGQACIWKNKDYLIDINLIKQYLIEVFDVEFFSEEVEHLKNLLDNFTLAKKIKWLRSPLPIRSFEIGIFLLEEIDKINKIKNFTFKQKLIFFGKTYGVYFENFVDSYLVPLGLSLTTLLGLGVITLGLIFQPCVVLGLTTVFFLAFVVALTRCGPELTKFQVLIGCLALFTCPLSMPTFLFIIIISALLNIIVVNVACLSKKPVQLFVSNQNLLLAQCIDDYFEGKIDLPSASATQLLKQYLLKKSELTEKEADFLKAIEIGENISYTPLSNVEIWQQGVQSWQHYRFLRKNNDTETQWVLNKLLLNNRLFQGSTSSFDGHLIQKQRIENYFNAAFEEMAETVLNNQALAKTIKPKDWSLFVKQLTDVNYRAEQLRKTIATPTHKFVHLTKQIIPYIKDIRKKNQKNYTHTKKTSTTLLSSRLNTPLFGTHHRNALHLVGFLFDQKKCKVKARFLQDSGTYQHGWLGSESEVKNYQTWINNRIVTDENLFSLKVQGANQTNEVLAQLNKEGLTAIVIGQDTPEARHLAISRQTEIKDKFSMWLPIIFYDASRRSIKLYDYQDILADKLLQRKKQNLINLHQAFLKKKWKLSFFCKDDISDKPVPEIAVYLNSKIQQLENSDKAYDFYNWALVEQEIRERLNQKCKQNKFFRILKGRTQDTLDFYQNCLTALTV